MKKRNVKISLSERVNYGLVCFLTCAGMTMGLFIPALCFKISEFVAHNKEVDAICEYMENSENFAAAYEIHLNDINNKFSGGEMSEKQYVSFIKYINSNKYKEDLYNTYPYYFNDSTVNELNVKTQKLKTIGNTLSFATLGGVGVGAITFARAYSLYNKEKKEKLANTPQLEETM